MSELYHHGVKGMKWGIRRYRDYRKNYKGRPKARRTFLKDQYNSQLTIAKNEARRHGVVGTVASAFGKTFVTNFAVTMAATPAVLLANLKGHPEVGTKIALGANAVAGLYSMNHLAEMVVRLGNR